MNKIYTIASILLLTFSQISLAQGVLKGVVTDAITEETLIGANILVNSANGAVSRGTVSTLDGSYQFTGLPAGSYTARVSFVGYNDLTIVEIAISDGRETVLNIEMNPGVSLNPVVVSASKIREKITESPSSIQVITAGDIQNLNTTTPADFLKGAGAVDVAQQGIISSTIVTRGFNNIFSGSLLMMTDNRIATVPSLRANVIHFIPLVNDDIESIEVVLGPGAALYGPNANAGVVNMMSKSPLSAPGTSIGVFGGNQSMLKAQFRTAHNVNDKIGIKLSGQYLQADEFKIDDANPYRAQEIAARQLYLQTGDANSEVGKRIGIRDYGIKKAGMDARIDIRPATDFTMILNAGVNQSSNIELTGLGTAQAVDWTYSYYQARLMYRNWFAQAFMNASNSGDSYIVPTGNGIVDKSNQFVAQLQHSADWNRFNFVYGMDYLRTTPRTEGTINGRFEEMDGFYEVGGYLQAKYAISRSVDLLGSFRADKHERLEDPIFSPRAALVVRPIENHNFRLTYNRSFQTPSSNALFLDLLASRVNVGGFYDLDIRAHGVPSSGFTFERDPSGRPLFISNFAPQGAPAMPMNTGHEATWGLIRQVIAGALARNPQTAALAPAMQVAPLPGSVNPAGGNYANIMMALAKLNTSTGSFDPVADVNDINAIQPTIFNTFEVGYKGIINNRMLLSADVYFTKAENFVGPLIVETPNVFLSGAQMAEYITQYFTNVLMMQGMPGAQAQATAQAIGQSVGTQVGQLPFGVVTPNEAFSRDAVILTYRNFGEINYFGIDLGFDFIINDKFRALGNYSYISNDKWLKLDDNPDFNVFLNAPQNKFMVGLDYENRRAGFDMGVKFRYVDGFPIQSGIYTTYNSGTDTYDKLDSYYSVDLNMGYDIPGVKGVRASLVVNNLTNNQKPQFAGTPEIGIFAVGGVTVKF